MSHITSIGAAIFTDMAITNDIVTAAMDTEAEFLAAFATEGAGTGVGIFSRVMDVREFPAIGTPANIVKVPVYGTKTSQQVQGQADAPNLELTINYVPSDWAPGTDLGDKIGDGKQYGFRFSLLNAKPLGYSSTAGATGLGSVENSEWYWVGKIEALLVKPSLTDASTATLTLSMQSEFFGAYTVAAV